MPDPRFFYTHPPLKAGEAAMLAGVEEPLSATGRISTVAAPDTPDLETSIVFVDGRDAAAKLKGRAVGLCLAAPAFASIEVAGPVVALENPRLGFALVAARLHSPRPLGEKPGVSQEARLGEGVRVAPGALVCAGAEIGARTLIGPGAVIGPGVVIGEDSEVGAGASICFTLAGARLCVLAGARIGERGFGFVKGPRGLHPVPQLGRVMIGDDVEIGANTTVDRGALDDTWISDGVKIDNLVQVGHNVRIGAHTVLAGQVGVSGSCVIGAGVMVGGQAGVADHLHVGDGALLGARAGVTSDVPAGEKWAGYPARPLKRWLREMTMLKRLAENRKKSGDEQS